MQVIYKLYWNKSNKLYVGKAISLKKRMYEHLKEWENGTHYNKLLQEQYNMYGEPDVSILETCEDDEVFTREVYWITTLSAQSEGLNLMGEQVERKTAWANTEVPVLPVDSNFKHVLIDEKNRLYHFNCIADFCREFAKNNGFTYTTSFSGDVGKVLRGVRTSTKGLRKYAPGDMCRMRVKKQYIFCENGEETQPYSSIIDYCRQHPVFKDSVT